MEAKLILNNFKIFNTSCIQVKLKKKKKKKKKKKEEEKYAQNRKQNVHFLMRMRIYKHGVISDTPVFSAFKGEYPAFLSDINF